MPHVRSVAVGVWVETGSRHEPEDRGGVSHLIEHLVFKGTATRSAEAIARTMDSVGGQMDAFTTKENTCFYVQVLDEHLPLAVDLLTDILLHPLFDAEELEREKSVVLQEIKMVEDTPDDIIHDLFAAQVWGDASAGRGPSWAPASCVTGFGRDAIADYFAERVRAAADHHRGGRQRHARAGASSCSARGFNGFTPAARSRGAERAAALRARRQHRAQDAGAGAPGHGLPRPGPRRARALRALLLNDIIGGSMSSRLFQEVRERQGLVYSIHSGAQAFADTGLALRLRGHRRPELLQGAQVDPQGAARPQEARASPRRS